MNEIAVHAVDSQDLDFVLAHPWHVTQDEIVAFGLHSPEEVRGHVEYWLRKSPYARSYRMEDQTIAVCGALPEDFSRGLFRTWFLASELFAAPGVGRRLTGMLRQWIAEGLPNSNVGGLVSYSASTHPKAEAWFRLLGFVPDGVLDGPVGIPIRRYVLKGG